ncbi:tRNA1(Val) (adenine(37)-N6)-methyltransferase [Paenalkalicoccus suaedae]|uniref:tRNA1(Val) (Adenine(37)-N6)-methyltransferase n=1 Tax=Paenalkalicoccus suaedae TaxID=2592382 RepID=A0A859F9U1_9BACI|nr:tRNA1(Val) (adenine(37)-N6)-methyltransferase [Paenalkalicoccus suaedae]QKS69627.1 tRNA1(Val) (adenine(37)-N6)-methyltransferase [Paenalkalicoccus suaedae]
MTRLDYLPGRQRVIYQRDDIFAFSIDAVLLARFVTLPASGKVVDLCTGTGAIPLLMSLRTKASILGVELQETLAELTKLSVAENKLEEQITVSQQDLNKLTDVAWGKYDVVTCNPPYFAVTADKGTNENTFKSLARHEIACTLEDVIRVSSRLVKSKGRVALVHRPERLDEIIAYMHTYKLAPKRIQCVHPHKGKDANMLLIEAVRDGGFGAKILPPWVLYQEDGSFTKEFAEHWDKQDA